MSVKILKSFFLFTFLILVLNLVPKKYYSVIAGNFYIKSFDKGSYNNIITDNNKCTNRYYNFRIIVTTFSSNSNHLLSVVSDADVSNNCIQQIYNEVVVSKPSVLNESSKHTNNINNTRSLNPTKNISDKDYIDTTNTLDFSKILNKNEVDIKKYDYVSPSNFFIFTFSLIVSMFYLFYEEKFTRYYRIQTLKFRAKRH
jgi:hypothetical protein